MQPISSKIKINRNHLIALYNSFYNDKFIQKSSDDSINIPEDIKLIDFSLQKKIKQKIRNKKESYVVDLNVFEILYIQVILQSLLPYLGLKAAEFQNFIFENRYNLNPYQLEELKKIHNHIFNTYKSLSELMQKLQSLNDYYKEIFTTIMNMQLEERINFYLQITEQIKIKEGPSEKIISIHRKL
ncbi:hypothetical protein FQB35_04820 [Crassaminicella thermophila]|uniref:Uncharacterized protein n=1 Tax=Crassaminicella thermophila TaxID=2599308 RepID=A0A5C0SC52_CRATE|nr:hypothetical protein [Crassaminicella thermophila]QEK11741.1 hypothetical protein FQB35_04820 [Crassaminicella thermophila]